MLGWEFPPFFAGGVGIVCNELCGALNQLGTDITFIMPSGPSDIYDNISVVDSKKPKFKIIVANNTRIGQSVKVRKIDSPLTAYAGFDEYAKTYEKILKRSQQGKKPLYGKNLLEEVNRFAKQVQLIVQDEDYDVIHAQDWVTYPAAIALKKLTGKPLVVHVHITEFDKSGGVHADSRIYKIEKEGMDYADKVIVVSNKIKDRCIKQYFIDPNKISVVHNAATPMGETSYRNKISSKDKIVLFAGRITLQKGPDYFVEAAKKVLEKRKDVKFVMAGTGDMLPKMIEMAADLGIANNFIFTGFYTRQEADILFDMADVCVMPSISEPFGVIPFEAQMKNTPTIISKQTGISEILKHTLTVDFWDTDDIANKILALLQYSALHKEIQDKGYLEAKSATWTIPASKCLNIYQELIHI